MGSQGFWPDRPFIWGCSGCSGSINDKSIQTVVTLLTQSLGINPISSLTEGTSVLLIHGEADETLPSGSSEYAYNLHTNLKIKMYENAVHSLKEVSDEVYMEVKSWIIDKLK